MNEPRQAHVGVDGSWDASGGHLRDDVQEAAHLVCKSSTHGLLASAGCRINSGSIPK